MAITRRQKQVLDFIAGFVDVNGYSPSYEEIARGLGLNSLATVHKHITNLQEKGLLNRAHNRSRSIDVIATRQTVARSRPRAIAPPPPERLPLLGRIAAGRPVETLENPDTISLSDITGSKDVFVLEVRGESMQDEHILSGDYVLVERVQRAREGEIVVALVNGSETTLKRFYVEGENVRLQPSNATMAPIVVPAQSVELQGRVVGILRRY